ncbi:MAG: Gfo/Idh/MocA family oxidoreductase [Clostridiales bacterium]|nr:Gfo/Idh/MocA family oxidoreductase [Clostridiales bacterium]
MQKNDGMNYAPVGKAKPVVKKGEFIFAAAALEHGHIYGMVNGLLEAGGVCKLVYDKDPAKVERFIKAYPEARAAASLEEILEDRGVCMVAAAGIASERGPLGVKVMNCGKDYFVDKTPFTAFAQIEAAKAATAATGRKYMVYFSERLHCEAAIHAGALIKEGVIGDVIQVLGLGPHRLNAGGRPEWFFIKERYGGILCDIGSHQIEQFLFYAGARDAKVLHSKVGNYNNPQYPELEDFGDAALLADNGCTNYFRVDWFTPDGLGSWGDGRAFILGTKGYVELRKYIDVGRDTRGGNLYLVTGDSEQYINVEGLVGFPFFGEMILDCLNRTENAMSQQHIFKAAELCVQAEAAAEWVSPRR